MQRATTFLFALLLAHSAAAGSSAAQKALEQIQKETGLAPITIPNTEGAYLGKTHRGYEVVFTAKSGNVWGRYAARLTMGEVGREVGGVLGFLTGQRESLGGQVVGMTVQSDLVYVSSKDNIVRALKRSSGNQQWKSSITTRPLFPPRVFAGVVAIVGQSPVLSTFRADSGAAVSTWMAPETDAVLKGAPLVDAPRPLAVSIVVVFGDGQVIGLRSTELMLKEPALTPLTVLPGRPLQRETLPGDPSAR